MGDRPVKALDRQHPARWEGDQVMGTRNPLAIGNLLKRASRYALLEHLGDYEFPVSVKTNSIKTLQSYCALSPQLAWDRGLKMTQDASIGSAPLVCAFIGSPRVPGNGALKVVPTGGQVTTSREVPTSLLTARLT